MYFPVPAITWASRSRSVSASTGAQSRQPARRRHLAAGHGGQGWLVELDDEVGAGHALGDLGHVRRGPLGQRGGQVGYGPGIGDGHVERARQLQRGGQCPGPAQLDLERPAEAVEDLLHDVQVSGEHGPGPDQVTARALGQPPAARRDLDRDLDQQRGGAAGEVGTGAAVRQLGQVGEIGELTGDDAHRLGRVGPGHRADPGRAAGRPGETGLVMVIRHMSSLEPRGDEPAMPARSALVSRAGNMPTVLTIWVVGNLRHGRYGLAGPPISSCDSSGWYCRVQAIRQLGSFDSLEPSTSSQPLVHLHTAGIPEGGAINPVGVILCLITRRPGSGMPSRYSQRPT